MNDSAIVRNMFSGWGGGSPGGGKVLLKLVGGNVLGEVSGEMSGRGDVQGGDVRNRIMLINFLVFLLHFCLLRVAKLAIRQIFTARHSSLSYRIVLELMKFHVLVDVNV